MPPRFVYWTILIDNKPTAFRAQDKDDLLPTLTQLRRTNKDVAMKYFAHGRVWDSPEQAREHSRRPASTEKRGRDWRPGGSHEDPRARFDGKSAKSAAGKPARPGGEQSANPRPWTPKPSGDGRPWTSKPKDERRPWHGKSGAPRKADGNRPPWQSSKAGGPGGDRQPWTPKPGGKRGPWTQRPKVEAGAPGGPGKAGGERRPWTPKPKDERRPWQSGMSGTGRPGEAGRPGRNGANRRPWSPKSNDQRRPWQGKPGGAGRPGGPAGPAEQRRERRPWQRDQPEEKKSKPPEEE